MNLASVLAASARENKNKTAFYWGEQQFSYTDLFQHAARLSHLLRKEYAVQPGDRVALWLKNCPEFGFALVGILLAGGVVVPINNFLKPDEVSFILEDSGVKVLITDDVLAPHVPALQARLPGLKVWQIERFGQLSQTPADEGVDLNLRQNSDLAVLIYTSGTTGRPKGAMLSHDNLLSNVESCREVLRAVQDDRFVVLLPMFHSFMLTVGTLLPLTVGGSMLLIKSLHPAKNIIQEIIFRQATLLPAVPQFFRALANAGLGKTIPLRICISGGAPLPVEILREFNAKMPIPLIEGYGLSEASPVVSINPIAGPWKEGSIGLPVPGVDVSVQDDNGQPLHVGATGEICVRGRNVMMGYWNQPDETAKVMRDNWLLTGDIGHKDADGYFFITDRKKDMLLVNGINVYPREIEEIIYQFKGVKEAAVIGAPDERRGEQPVAFVALEEGAPPADEKAMLQFIRARLADYKVPRKINFMPALPRNATGKILKRALREQLAK